MRAILAALLLCFFAVTADARGHHKHHRPFSGARHMTIHTSRGHSHASSATFNRPSDCYGIPWCGCLMRHLEGETNRAYNLARKWADWGHATVAHIGAIVVWPHHVGKIVGGSPGRWEVLSGNDGNRVRIRVRSVSNAIAFREKG